MKALFLVLLFWIAVAALTGWVLGLRFAMDNHLTALVITLLSGPFLALSALLWRVFSELFDG